MIKSTNLKINMPASMSSTAVDVSKLFNPTEMTDYVEGSLRMYLKVTGKKFTLFNYYVMCLQYHVLYMNIDYKLQNEFHGPMHY